MVSVWVMTFPAMQSRFIASGAWRSNPWYKIKEWLRVVGYLDAMHLRLLQLFLQMLLVCQDVMIPLCDGLMLAYPDLLSHLERERRHWSPAPFRKQHVELVDEWSIFTRWISLKSWLTRIVPPSNSLMASPSASMVSISKWLVGSSRNNKWGFCQASQAKHTRHFWPSDKFLIGLTWGKKV